jgi:hypothetical protein
MRIPPFLAQQDAGGRVADGQARGLHLEIPDGLNLVAQKGAGELGREHQRGAVVVVHGQVAGRRLDGLQVPDARGRHVEGVRPLEPQLGRHLHGGRRLEVLAGDAAADDEIDLVQRHVVDLEAVLGRGDGVIRDDSGPFVRFQVAVTRLAKSEDVLDCGRDGKERLIGSLKTRTDPANDLGVVDAVFREGDARFGQVQFR